MRNGAPGRFRTRDPMLRRRTLCPRSYGRAGVQLPQCVVFAAPLAGNLVIDRQRDAVLLDGATAHPAAPVGCMDRLCPQFAGDRRCVEWLLAGADIDLDDLLTDPLPGDAVVVVQIPATPAELHLVLGR